MKLYKVFSIFKKLKKLRVESSISTKELKKIYNLPTFKKVDLLPFVADDYYKINPFFVDDKSGYIRFTSESYTGKTDFFGRMKRRESFNEILNGIYKFEIKDSIVEYEELFPVSKVPNFEDPRVIDFYNRKIIYLTEVKNVNENSWDFNVSFFDLNSMEKIEIENLGLNKNYIAKVESRWLTFITSTMPEVRFSYNLDLKMVENKKESYSIERSFNGGSNFFMVNLNDYRVVRKRYLSKKHGAFHLNYILRYKDNSINAVSRPFYFKEKNLEVCNSVLVSLSEINFYVTINDLDSYRFSCDINDFESFFNENIDFYTTSLGEIDEDE